MDPLIVLDAFMALGALFVGVWSYRNRDLKRAIGAATVFGLLAGVIWIRAGANDVMFAEAAIGATLCALLLASVLNRLSIRPSANPVETNEGPAHRRLSLQ